MNQAIYEQIKSKLTQEYEKKMGALDEIASYLNEPVKNGSIKTFTTAPKPEMKVLKEIPVNAPPKRIRLDRVVKTVPCEFAGCLHRVHLTNAPCAECTKKVCAIHKRKDICKACEERP